MAEATPQGRNRFRLAVVLLLLTVALAVAGLAMFVLNRHTPVPVSWGTDGGARDGVIDWFNTLLQTLAVPLMAGIIAVLIIRRQAAQVIGWLLLAFALVTTFMTVVSEVTIYSYFTTSGGLPGPAILAWLSNWIWVLVYGLILLLPPLFPDGRFLSRRWRRLVLALVTAYLLLLSVGSAVESPMTSTYQLPNPLFGDRAAALNRPLIGLGVPMMPLTALAGLSAVMARYRRRTGRERQQIKWLLFGAAVMALLVLSGLVLSFGFGVTAGEVLVNAASIGPVLGIGVALLRHQLYDIDFIIRRTAVYAVLSALLGLVYFGSVVVLQRVVEAVTGQQSALVIVLSTLLIAALFAPLRRRVQDAIDQRFYRQAYDAQQVLARFARSARDETDLNVLRKELAAVVRETIRPEHVSIWLRR